ncbi:MAG TPA: hypothetical protein VMJ64_13410 [Anaerolineales bacterium]|nr:hypothetical protein [Anaerolineales bacterium]
MKTRLLPVLALTALLSSACGSLDIPTPDPKVQIELAVAATLSSLPKSTPIPPPTPYPTPLPPTPVSLSGVFCEYQFCIGHPKDMAFYDVSAAQNQASPSSYTQGILAAYSSSLFLQVVWQPAPGATDPQFMLPLVMQYGADQPSGGVQQISSGRTKVFFQPITPTAGAASTLPYGAAAAWLCGGRAFAWKVYTPQEAQAPALLNDALARFRCE